GALGYDQSIEGYTGTNWTVNVAGRAYEIGLTDGNDNFVGSQACTREQAALYAVNTLQATLVEYENKGSSITINGIEVVQGASEPTYVTSSIAGAATSIDDTIDNTQHDYTVEFAERYQPDLKLTDDTDDFMRPAHTWSWKSNEIGTYVDHDLMVAEYTTGVTGRELYDLLTATTIRNYDLYAYTDGVENDGGTGVTKIVKENLIRGNTETLNDTGNGVLTQVFVDNDDDEIIITSINTYLAQATSNYSSSKETVTLKVYETVTGSTQTVDVDDVPEVEGVERDAFYLVNMSGKNTRNNDLEVVAISDVEILEDSTVTKWSDSSSKVVSKLTTGGTQYDAAEKAFYDEDTLDAYDDALLTDMSYNIYLDPYGYVIGVDLYEGTLNYVFITGYDRSRSNISVRTAEAAAIFTDGTMDVITVNVKDTNDNIADYNRVTSAGAKIDTQTFYKEWSYGGNDDGDYNNGNPVLNRWYTYTVNESGVYTLKPAIRSFSTAVTEETTIDCSNVRLEGRGAIGDKDSGYENGNVRAYGEDASIFITVEQDDVDTMDNAPITDVTGTYTGVQDVELIIDPDAVSANEGGTTKWAVHTVYDKDNYIIASIVVGEAKGSVANYAYVLSDSAESEEKIDDTYYWEVDVIMGGQIQTVTVKSKYTSVLRGIVNDTDNVVELRFDGDYVIGYDDVDYSDIYTDYTKPIDDEDVYYLSLISGDLSLQGRTLYVLDNQDDYGLTFTREAKAVVIQDEYNKEVKTEFDSVEEALDRLADASTADGLQYKGEIIAILNSQGVAEWVVFVNQNGLHSDGPDYGNTDNDWDVTVNTRTMRVDATCKLATAGDYPTANEVKEVVAEALEQRGLMVTAWGDESKLFSSGDRTITVVDPDLDIAIQQTYTVQVTWA
ncbi:hypothetical protein H9X91_13960, partial [Oscillibacter valericigenes]|nr:hypothetical protein [Oscillibacter valericigenes]